MICLVDRAVVMAMVAVSLVEESGVLRKEGGIDMAVR